MDLQVISRVISRAGYPLERMAVDVLGPFPATETGNKYVLVVGDYFTKWTEAYAVPNQEAKTLARKIVDEFVCRFGAPEILHSDQGRNFESTLFKEMCTMLDIRKTRTTAYHPESDSMVERFNRTLAAMLSKYVAKHQKDWDMYLPQVMMAYRSSEHESTKYTPHRLMIGREIHLPVDVMFGRVPDHQPELSQYVRELRESLEEAYEHARENLQASQQRQKAYYNQRATGTPFQVGDLVWLWVKEIKKGQTRKLKTPWEGPYVVLQRLSDVTYRIQLKGGHGRKQVVHYNRLRLCVVQKQAEADPDEHVRRPEVEPLRRAPEYQPDETDLLYMRNDLFDSDEEDYIPEAAVPQIPVPAARPRRNINPPAWLNDYVAE